MICPKCGEQHYPYDTDEDRYLECRDNLETQLNAARLDSRRLDKLDREAVEHGNVEIHVVRGYQTIREIIDSTEVEGEV